VSNAASGRHDELIAAIRTGVGYVNVHSTTRPLRGRGHVR